ncbi:C6 finger domain-containing protein [Colletotrichum chrysophilum]|uniref:C6 finger domain-containing protein n=1 Tax=Colletotrichum chrysophilum TaxID=1836956 RepID=A0AAD9AYF3_9PEZI|nr:C6 finger domain-containing protein [Colletotrichum chrysophilum]
MSETSASNPKHGDPGCTCTTCHVAKRRSHKKSRNGCKSCKRRRIKCDEVKPRCGQCLKALITCEFALVATQPDPHSIPETTPEANAALQPRKRGRPRKNWDPVLQGPSPPYSSVADSELPDIMSLGSTPCDLPLTTDCPPTLPSPMWMWTVDDMELQHHYMTSDDLCPGDFRLWREKVPRLAFSNHCVLHLLLAVSALHLARQRSDEAARFELIADGHYSIGLRQIMDILPNLNTENAGALYIASTLVCSYSFAQRPSPGHLLIISDGAEVAWFELLRGVRMVVETIGFHAIFAGVLGPMPTEQPEEEPPAEKMTERLVEWEPAVRRISDLIAVTNDQNSRIYEKVVTDLSECFAKTFGTAQKPRHAFDGKMEIIIAWVYRMEDEFVECLKEKKHVALLILAHFVVLLKTLDWLWYMDGWASHILHGVALYLGPEFADFLRWPREETERLNEEKRRRASA